MWWSHIILKCKMCLRLLSTPHIQGIPGILCYQYPLLFQKSFSCRGCFSCPAAPRSLNIQHVVEVGDVTNGESQDLDLGQPLVRWERWEQFSQLCEGHIEGHHADSLPGGVRGSIFSRRAPPSPLFLPAESGRVHGARRALSARGLGRHGPALLGESVQEGLRVRLSPGQVGPGLVGTEHHASVLRQKNTSNLGLIV